MTDNINLLENIERYLSGQMPADERAKFDDLRKTNAEVDQTVVEHLFFMQQLDHFGKTKTLRSQLHDVHNDLASKGAIAAPGSRAKIVYLFNRYKRTAALAASGNWHAVVAGIIAIATLIGARLISPR